MSYVKDDDMSKARTEAEKIHPTNNENNLCGDTAWSDQYTVRPENVCYHYASTPG